MDVGFAGLIGTDPGFTAATGGTVTTDGDYKVHKFTADGDLNVTNKGPANSIEYLIVAGGGGAGYAGGQVVSGGGGAGGFLTNTNGNVILGDNAAVSYTHLTLPTILLV